MNGQNKIKLNWRSALGAIALAVGAFGISASPARSLPTAPDSLIAQVGVRSRINSPTPLNLRPRTHISSPSDRSSSYYRHSEYRRGGYYPHDGYGYGHHHHHHHHHHYGHRRRRNKGPVIIINPATSNYSRYTQDSYIRIINK